MPRCWARARKPTSSRMAPLTRISAVVSCRRSRVADRRFERPAPATVIPPTAARTTNPPRSTSLAAVLVASREKNSDSRTTVAKSATDEAAIVSWPSGDAASPASFKTGTMSPSDVAESVIATSSGRCTIPMPSRAALKRSASPNETTNPTSDVVRNRPLNRDGSTSRPARNSSIVTPRSDRIRIGVSRWTHPRTEGPMTMPATISRTTAGRRRRGRRPRSNGAPNAAAATSVSPVNDTSGISRPPRAGCYRSRPQRP